MWLARAYLATARGRASLALAVTAMTAAFTMLDVAVSQPGGPDVGSVALFGLALLAACVAFGVGAMSVLRDRRLDILTLRALGWPERTLQLRLLTSSASIGLLVGVAALPLSFAAQLATGGFAAAGVLRGGLMAASGAGSFGMVVMSSWWPVRTVVRGRRACGGGLRRVVKGVAITAAGMALSLELAVRWAWAWHSVPRQVTAVGWAVVAVIVVLAVATVGDLDLLAARERAGESRTLRAMGWSARGMAWQAAQEAALFGSAAGLVTGALDVAGCLAVAHRMPHRMVAVVLIAVAAGAAISVLAAGAAGVAGTASRVRRESHHAERPCLSDFI